MPGRLQIVIGVLGLADNAVDFWPKVIQMGTALVLERLNYNIHDFQIDEVGGKSVQCR